MKLVETMNGDKDWGKRKTKNKKVITERTDQEQEG